MAKKRLAKTQSIAQQISVSGEASQPKPLSKIFAVDIFPVPEQATHLDGLRQKVFNDRYAWKGEEGELLEEVPDQMWGRVARTLAAVEKTSALRKAWEEKFYQTLSDFKFLPGGRILSAAGTGYEVTYYNCFVIPSPEDSRGGILDNLKVMTEILSRAGGVGINLSTLRPRGARVHKVNGTSSGPVNWANLFSVASHDVIQQGGTRRGALMLMIHDWHPDVAEFIDVKKDLTRLVGANLSVCVSDDFMQALAKDEDWVLKFPDTKFAKYDAEWDGDIKSWEEKGYPVKVHGTVKASQLWDKICQAAWASAEPGIHFLDRSNKWSNTWYFEKLVATNPCGEQPLGPWAVCNLGSLNLAAFVNDGQMDYQKLAEVASVATRMLDNVVDANFYFYEENERQQKSIRRVGLGTMGLGDALIKMQIRYGSSQSLEVIEKIYQTIRDAAYSTSADLAKEKGAFPKYDRDKYNMGHHIQQLPEEIREKIYQKGIRNAVLLTQAPTGSTSLLAGVSSGIEPVYDFAMVRRDRIGEHVIYHPLYKEWKDTHGEDQEVPDYFVSANDLTPDDHILVQAVVQKYTDSSISKTVNAPKTHTIAEVKKLYTDAYNLGCKGITYMRDGSRDGVLSHVEEKAKDAKVQVEQVYHRPMMLRGRTYKVMTPVGEGFVTVNRDDKNQPFEVFVTIGKAGMHTSADAEAIGRLASLALRTATGDRREIARKIISHLRGIGGSSQIGFGKERVMSLADGIAKILAEEIAQSEDEIPEAIPLNLTVSDGALTNGHATNGVNHQAKQLELPQDLSQTSKMADLCPECGQATFTYEEGCKKCHSCGYSLC
ncbi:adenosylcobalamin-dependent ribonucleoside-diphosphate reductase [Patescibacteria group bacterium]|nr:adenosylcobalamin-dependent ribonucleoside-diphosphate reductase [Patescibacteria group bacterium]MCL5409890.1 adenosylcobalamin-dependent ribonucleoside-diphosphate reductase [Patescibacteria group bacterium]